MAAILEKEVLEDELAVSLARAVAAFISESPKTPCLRALF